MLNIAYQEHGEGILMGYRQKKAFGALSFECSSSAKALGALSFEKKNLCFLEDLKYLYVRLSSQHLASHKGP